MLNHQAIIIVLLLVGIACLKMVQPAPAPPPTSMPVEKFNLSKAPGVLRKHLGRNIKVFDEIVKSDQDECSYRFLTLENGLQALLISDPTLDKVVIIKHYFPNFCRPVPHWMSMWVISTTQKRFPG